MGTALGIIPPNEPERLAAVRRYDILDTPPDGAFDRITAIAARRFGVPIAIISIVDHERIWFKSHHGVDVPQIGRHPGLCASAILQDGPWVLTDAGGDLPALANPLVAGEFGLRFYAGMPLRTGDGFNLGTLCVIGREPREVTSQEIADLRDLAAIVMDRLELRLSARRAIAQYEAELAERRRLAQSLEERVNSATEERLKAEIALQQAQKMEVIGELTSGIARRLQQSADDHCRQHRNLAAAPAAGGERSAPAGGERHARHKSGGRSHAGAPAVLAAAADRAVNRRREPARHRLSSSVAAHTRRKDCD